MNKVLDVQNLHVSFDTYAGEVKAVRGVTFSLSEGEVLAIVGESGCGKSVTAQTIMKLNPMPPARIKEGSVFMTYPYQLVVPAVAISLTMLSFNLLGDGLRDAFDPRLRR